MASVNDHENKINKIYVNNTPPFMCNLSNSVKLCTVTMPSNSSAVIHFNCTGGYNASIQQAGSFTDIYIRSSNQSYNTEIGINVVGTKNSYLSNVGYTSNGNNKFTIYCNIETYATGIIISAEHTHSIEWHLSNNTQHPSDIIKNNTIAYSKLWKEGDTITNAVWNDYAEYFPKGEETEPGDIVALDINSPKEQYIKADCNSKRVIGVHSDTYGHLIGGDEISNGDYITENNKKYIPIGLAGRVYVKVKGKVKLGDYIIPSSEKGIGRAPNEDAEPLKNIVGYVVEADNRTDIRRVKIFITNGDK